MTDDIVQFCKSLFDLMRRFWSSFGHQMNGVLVRGGINVPQYMALVALEELGEATMGQLSKRLHVTMGASTNLVDKLIRGGYASRTRGLADRRVVKVKLEAKGREILKEIEEKATSFMMGVLCDVEPERRKQFLESCTRMVAIAEAKETTEALAGAKAG